MGQKYMFLSLAVFQNVLLSLICHLFNENVAGKGYLNLLWLTVVCLLTLWVSTLSPSPGSPSQNNKPQWTIKLQQIFCCQIYLQLEWTALAKSSSYLQQMIVDKIYKTIAPHQPTKIQVMWMVCLTHFLYSRKAEAAKGRLG